MKRSSRLSRNQPLKAKKACPTCGKSLCGHGRKPSLKRKSRLQSTGPIKPVNRERADKKFDRNFHSSERVAWVNQHSCAYCGADNDTIRNDHVVKRGAGGAGGGYTKILPACHDCDTVRENKGLPALLELRGLTMADVEWKLAALNREWREYAAWQEREVEE